MLNLKLKSAAVIIFSVFCFLLIILSALLIILWHDNQIPFSQLFSAHLTFWIATFFVGILITILLAAYMNHLIHDEQEKFSFSIVSSLEKTHTKQIEYAMDQLTKTQERLVTQEKLASLGFLIAGIAHEIKNPLNFITNFSHVSIDLLKDLQEVLKPLESSPPIPSINTKDVKEIVDTLNQSLQKINQHGQRATQIIQGMLQLSRGESGQRQEVDLKRFLEEAMNLAYEGMHAKNSSFNVTLLTEFDPSIELMKLVPSDIHHVILNLLDNAFYSTNQKSKEEGEHYKPTVTVKTKNLGKMIQISVWDNGKGIPEEIKKKLPTPFFSTKSPGEGTGLGLSICFDLIKRYGGDLSIRSVENQFAEFTFTIVK